MALEDVMDAIAARVATGLAGDDATTGLPGLKACYSTASSAEGAAGVPASIDDWPIGFVGLGGGGLDATDYEVFTHTLELVIWVSAYDPGYAYRVIIPLIDRAKVHFRDDIDANGTAQRVTMTGYDRLRERSTAAGVGQESRRWLLLPIQLEVFELTVGGALYST